MMMLGLTLDGFVPHCHPLRRMRHRWIGQDLGLLSAPPLVPNSGVRLGRQSTKLPESKNLQVDVCVSSLREDLARGLAGTNCWSLHTLVVQIEMRE